MKTVILKKAEMDKLPKDVQKLILDTIKETENTTKSLKERIKALTNKNYDYRSDIEKISADAGGENLFFDIWVKTDGEQWGNCAGRKYTVRLGTKYIRVDVEGYRTNSRGSDWSFQISANKLSEILDLLEEAETANEVDAHQIRIIAATRIQNCSND